MRILLTGNKAQRIVDSLGRLYGRAASRHYLRICLIAYSAKLEALERRENQ